MGYRIIFALTASLWAAWPAFGGEPAVNIERNRLRSGDLETVLYRYRPGSQAYFDHVEKVLKGQGIEKDKDYFFDREDTGGFLAVTGKRELVGEIIELLAWLIEQSPQVRIDVTISETISSGDAQSGIDFSWDRKGSERTFFRGFSMDNRPQAYLDNLLSPSMPFQGTTAELGTVDSNGNILNQKQYDRVGALYMAIRAVAENQRTEVLAQPSVLVSSGANAVIDSGSKYPYQTVIFTGTSTVFSTQQLSIGLNMNITPWVLGKDKIKLDLKATVTSVAGFVEIAQGARNPFTDKRTLDNTVILDSGSSLTIGGIFQNEDAVVEHGVPILMDIPLLGYLFKSYWVSTRKRELIFQITPKIVDTSKRIFVPGE